MRHTEITVFHVYNIYTFSLKYHRSVCVPWGHIAVSIGLGNGFTRERRHSVIMTIDDPVQRRMDASFGISELTWLPLPELKTVVVHKYVWNPLSFFPDRWNTNYTAIRVLDDINQNESLAIQFHDFVDFYLHCVFTIISSISGDH